MKKNKYRNQWLELIVSGAAAAALTFAVVGVRISDDIQAAESTFMGGSPTVENMEGMRRLRILFPAGVRSNWHSHEGGGQLLMIEEGRGRAQNRGGPVIEYGPGDSWFTPSGVEHWHGATPNEDALQWTFYAGDVNWLEPVSDEEYLVGPD